MGICASCCAKPSGESYNGSWSSCEKDGDGVYTYASGDKYTGTFVKDKRSGKGVMEWKLTGDVYVGEFFLDQMHGAGVMKYGNGDRYDGTS